MDDFFTNLKTIFDDPSVNEICVNGIRSLSVFKNDEMCLKSTPFSNNSRLIRQCQEFALAQGQRLDAYSPSAGGQIEDGMFRWHCVIPPASSEGAIFCLRKHRFSSLELEDFKMSLETERTLKTVFENPNNHILFCGPTGSGKTSLLSAFLKRYAMKQRVILVEEHAELPMESVHWIRLLSRRKDVEGKGDVKLSYLIEESLRLRPDRIAVGEIRNVDSLIFFETVLLGHYGSVSTIHGSHREGVQKRINALLSMRKGGAKQFWANLEGTSNLWYVFLERGSPPSVVGIQAHASVTL